MGNNKYTDEFRREIADYVISTGRPITEVVKEPGPNDKTVNDWVLRRKRSQGRLPQRPRQPVHLGALASWAREDDVGLSCGRTSSRHDNAAAGSFFAVLKSEMYCRRSSATREEAGFAVGGSIESSTTAGAPTRQSATGCRPT